MGAASWMALAFAGRRADSSRRYLQNGKREGHRPVERIRNGLRLVRASWDVLRADREMLLLPLLSLLSSIGLLAIAYFGLFADRVSSVRMTGSTPVPAVAEWIALAVLVYLLSYVTIFFNVALVCAADERMRGGDPTVGSALAEASTHAVAIAPWALVSVIVSAVIQAIQERGGLLGRIIGGMLGLAWALITYLVLPVLVIEGLSVREAIARSKELFVKTWGETVSGEIGLGLIGFLAMVIPFPFLFLLGAGGSSDRLVIAVGLAVLWFLLVTVVMSALNIIFRVALYQYAADGETPEGFKDVGLGSIFPAKRRRGLFGRTA
jgi:MFS family permease